MRLHNDAMDGDEQISLNLPTSRYCLPYRTESQSCVVGDDTSDFRFEIICYYHETCLSVYIYIPPWAIHCGLYKEVVFIKRWQIHACDYFGTCPSFLNIEVVSIKGGLIRQVQFTV